MVADAGTIDSSDEELMADAALQTELEAACAAADAAQGQRRQRCRPASRAERAVLAW